MDASQLPESPAEGTKSPIQRTELAAQGTELAAQGTELAVQGAELAARGAELAEAERWTRRLALSHYENFIVGGLLTPKRMRQHFYNIYAYCRTADDLADELDSPTESLRRLDEWETWLDDCYAGRPLRHPSFVALRSTITQFNIPQAPFSALLQAFRQDQRQVIYATHEQLIGYCSKSANPVGHMILHLAGCYSDERAVLSDYLCTGLQLANFWQDVRRDAMRGRVYVPENMLQLFDVDRSALRQDAPPPGAQEMLRALTRRAETYFHRGLPLVHDVPAWLGRNLFLFASGGLAILDGIGRARYDVWTKRPTVSRLTQTKLVWQAIRGRWSKHPHPTS